MSLFISALKWLLIAGLALLIAGCAFLQFHPAFGGEPDEASLARMKASRAWNGEKFVNLEETPLLTGERDTSLVGWAWKMINPPAGKNPGEPLPSVALDKSALKNGSVAWFGHSTVLFQTGGKVFITDPVFYRASPVPFTGQPFKMTYTPTIAELPELDAVLISHDHYDHLDYRAIEEIDAKTKHFYVPLGVKAHLRRWGVAEDKITELDWDEGANLGNINITFVPARHFSGRRMGEDTQNRTLWGGYVIKSPDLSLYFSADSGYGKHYKERIAKYAPFDFVMIEDGAYGEGWALIHEFPEQAVQALLDVGANKAMPIHWGKFDLADHNWKDPIERLTKAAPQHQIDIATPKIGQVFNIFEPLPQEKWWEAVK